MDQPPESMKVSAVSYVIEPPECYAALDSAGVRSPTLVEDGDGGEAYVLPGLDRSFPLAAMTGAGDPVGSHRLTGRRWADVPLGAWDPAVRLEAMDKDGVIAQVLYPSLGLEVFGHPDLAYQEAIFDITNDWLLRFRATAPERFALIFLTAFDDPDRVAARLRDAKARGFVGVVVPGVPGNIDVDYTDPAWDVVWATAVELGLVLTFHARVSPEYGLRDGMGHRVRSPIHGYLNVTRNPQQLLCIFIGSGVFDRHPQLRVLTAEADASWAPQFGVRLRHWRSVQSSKNRSADGTEQRAPDYYLWKNVWYAVTDDEPALRMRQEFGPAGHLLWSDAFPTVESDWPNSTSRLEGYRSLLSDEELAGFTREHVARLYGLTEAR